MNFKRRAVAGALWVSVETWGTQLIQLLLFVILTRLLGPETYGLLGMAIIVIALGDVAITNGGWGDALIHERDLDQRHLDTTFWFLLLSSTLLAVLVAALAVPMARLFGQPELVGVLMALAPMLPLSSLPVVPEALLRRELRFAPLAARSQLATLAAGAVAIPMAFTGFGVWSLVAYQLAQPVAETLVIWHAHPWRPGRCFSRPALSGIVRYVGGALGDRVMNVLDFLIPRFVVGYALGAAPLGHFTTARKIQELLSQLLIRPISRVALPSFAGIRGDAAGMRELLSFGSAVANLVAFPAHVGLALVAPELVPLVFGPQWAETVPVVQVLALLGLLMPMTQVTASLMYGIGRTGLQMLLSVGSAVLFLLLLLLLGPGSLMAISTAFVGRLFLVFPLRLWLVQRASGVDVRPALARSCPILVATALMAAAVLAWRQLAPQPHHPVPFLASAIAIGLATYGVAILLLARPLVQQTVGLLLSVMGPRKPRAAAVGGSDPAAPGP
ncbi:lipopolysaccharide biosynthesis protein [Benzoatithermus flavus]|uniref:Lipopolysaccharide biosynthesis protein n=1 Tax=Benzoatithermus flavus TaxID=3108223 RepID=A0ABU8XRZ9_9PROT